MKTLRLILGDQLHEGHSWFKRTDPAVTYVMMEIEQETSYVTHHIQKLAGFFAAMRNFCQKKQKQGHKFIYIRLDDPTNLQTFENNISALIERNAFSSFEYIEPDEYRLDQQLRELGNRLPVHVSMAESEHFLSSRSAVGDFFSGKNKFLMESFYRHMRRKNNILMEDGKPAGGQWNYDQDNRKSFTGVDAPPNPLLNNNNVQDIIKMLQQQNTASIGKIDADSFIWPVSREQSVRLLDYFCDHLLQDFGTYQDAMVLDHWAMFHSRLSFALNTKMVSPLDVITRVIQTWESDKNRISINQVEGFIRQILGWREYMRGVYWALMPDFAEMNYFGHGAELPSFFWDANTKMQCLHTVIAQSLEYAYAHHIQRLMVTGNFSLLAGINPDEVDRWYLGIYIDAIEWVEITNTRGMSQFADGGFIATKPYVSSANYIQKMSDYCKTCVYNKKKSYGEKACPFNSLYWHFYHRHREKLLRNPRIGMVYRIWDQKRTADKKNILYQAERYLSDIKNL